jgi:predicted transcriptional regulator
MNEQKRDSPGIKEFILTRNQTLDKDYDALEVYPRKETHPDELKAEEILGKIRVVEISALTRVQTQLDIVTKERDELKAIYETNMNQKHTQWRKIEALEKENEKLKNVIEERSKAWSGEVKRNVALENKLDVAIRFAFQNLDNKKYQELLDKLAEIESKR